MAIIHARSAGEVREYMNLAMIDCDDVVIIDAIGSRKQHGQWVDEYEVRCGQNGVPRTFEFTIEPRPPDFDGGRFGYGPEPSTLIDAGEWYLVVVKYLEAGAAIQNRAEPLDVPAADQISERYYWAWAAVQEILKFIPEDAEELPESAIWTNNGRIARELRGDQLNRTNLVEISDNLWKALVGFRQAYAGKAADPER